MARFYGRARGVVMGLGRRLGGIPGGPGLAARKPPPVSGGGFLRTLACSLRPLGGGGALKREGVRAYGTSVPGVGDQTQ